MQTENSKSIEQIIIAIRELDLKPIKFKLMNSEDGPGWTPEYIDMMEEAYRRFLILVVKHPDIDIAPTRDIDLFWHGHILDTQKYARDCQQVFGHFLHHFPYFGMRGDEDARKQEAASEALNRLFQEEFGESPCPVQPAMEAGGYCVVSRQGSAYCVVAKASEAFPDPAYCVVAKASESSTNPAYCVVSKASGPASSAYCVVAKQGQAYCVVSRPGQPQESEALPS